MTDMITFGFNNRMTSIFRALCAIAAGVLFLVVKEDTPPLIVKIIGAFMFASGLVSFIYSFRVSKGGGQGLMLLNCVVDIVFGALLFAFAGTVVNVVFGFVGILLVVLGIFLLIVLLSVLPVMGVATIVFVLPAVAVVGGILLLFSPWTQSVMVFIAGIALILYGVSELLTSYNVGKALEVDDIQMAQHDDSEPDGFDTIASHTDVKDVEFEKIDDQE